MDVLVTPQLALAFANTRYWRGSPSPTDELADWPALRDWLDRNGIAPRRHVPALFDQAIALRETLYRVLAGQQKPCDIARLQAAIAAAPPRNRLVQTKDGFAWQLDVTGDTVTSLLAPVLWSAGDLLTGESAQRLRTCNNDKCLYLFIDSSRSAARRWCDMKACGNRAKAHRHYLKSKAA